MSIRDLERMDGSLDDDSPGCCYYVTKYFLIFLFSAYFILIPGLSIYVGVTYYYCQDMFAPWLISGGILGYSNLLLCLVRRFLKISFDVQNDCLLYTICVLSAILLIWWVWGFGRIFHGARLEDPVMKDPVCKEYLYRFPFWLTITPFIMIWIGLFGGICTTALE
jgi:hypothetical protein